ncbi:MAG TPA: hypothetical protein VGM19_00985 [Armatimonadota bacterium]|jgi:uncharacterized protein (DUF58 family)
MRGLWVWLILMLLAALVVGTLVRASGLQRASAEALPGGPPSFERDAHAYWVWLAALRESDPALFKAYAVECSGLPVEYQAAGKAPLSFDGFRSRAWERVNARAGGGAG